jgi:Mn2+/Fe2+ NRAMP family transporter
MNKKTTPQTAKNKKSSNPKKSVTVSQTSRDLTIAMLIVSLLVNVIVLIVWLMLQLSDRYDSELLSLLGLH